MSSPEYKRDALGSSKNINKRLAHIVERNRVKRFITVIYYHDWYTPVLVQWNFKFKVYEVVKYMYAHEMFRLPRHKAMIRAREWADAECYPYLKGDD